jgi:adenylyl-sulfate kinase
MGDEAQRSPDVVWQAGLLEREARRGATGGPGLTVWFTGLSGSGKSTLAHAVERALVLDRRAAYVLDGDNLRHGLNGDLGFGDADRDENVRRTAEVSALMADAGLVVLVSLVSPFRAGRDRARRLHGVAGLPFVEVFVDTSLEECRRRDPKGLYARAAAGELTGLTGVDAPYEAPDTPELHLRTDDAGIGSLVDVVVERIRSTGV